jgi:hypothetical protein
LPSITGGLSNFGMATGFAFSGGSTKLPLLEAAGDFCADSTGAGEAVGAATGFGVAATAAAGVVVV